MTSAARRSYDEAESEQPAIELPGENGRTGKRDAVRTQRLRTVIRYMLERDTLMPGHQVRLATHFHLTRQRVHQLVTQERERLKLASVTANGGRRHAAKRQQSASNSAGT